MRRLGLVLLTAGCHIEEAPATLNEAFRAWWSNYEAPDEDLEIVLQGTMDVVDLDALAKGPVEGTQERLSADDLVGLDFTTPEGAPADPPDPTLARPLHVVSRVGCSLDAFERILVHDDQRELYGTYDAYERTYLTSKEAFTSGEAATLDWQGTIEQDASIFGAYTYTFRTQARRVAVPEDAGLAGPELIVTRNWLPFPATWTRGNGAFPQDYQLEVWVPIGEDELLHVYPIWRVLETSAGDMDSDLVASFNLGKMKDWDRRTEQLCEDGVP